MNYAQRLERFDNLKREGLIIRKEWTGERGGRATACLLTALSPETGVSKSASTCPSDVMPAWLAYLTPWMDDNGSDAAWPAFVDRYAALAHRWQVLSPEAWNRLDYAARAICVREAMSHTKVESVREVCERVAGLCERVATGGEVTEEQWRAEAAEAAGWAAKEAAEAWAEAAAEAAKAAGWAAAAEAAKAAGWAAAAEAEAAEAAAEAAKAAGWAAEAWAEAAAEAAKAAASVDRITTRVLDAIEAEIAATEEMIEVVLEVQRAKSERR